MRLLTFARDLRRRKARERQSLFVVEGIRAVEELLALAARTSSACSLSPQLSDQRDAGVERRASACRTRLEVATVTEREFASAAETESPQGVLAIAEIPDALARRLRCAREPGALLVLDAVQDPGNVGTIDPHRRRARRHRHGCPARHG